MIHTGKKSYECEICKKTFSYKSNLAKHKKTHTLDKPFACDLCQKSYSQTSQLLRHNKTTDHLNKKKGENKDSSSIVNNYVECVESIKIEDIKEEMNEEESVDDPLSIQGQTNSDVSENIVTEVKEEEIRDDPLCINDTTNEDLSDQNNINNVNNLNVNNIDEEVVKTGFIHL